MITGAPWNHVTGDSIFARVIASNIKGASEPSEKGNGASIINRPDSPYNLVEDMSEKTKSTIGLTWTEGAYNGGSPIIDYRISMAE